jgi:hypothetical protein
MNTQRLDHTDFRWSITDRNAVGNNKDCLWVKQHTKREVERKKELFGYFKEF